MSDPGSHEPLSRRLARRALRRAFAVEARLARTPLPRNDRGASLDPVVRAVLSGLARIEPAGGALRPVGLARHEYDTLGPILDSAPAPMAQVEDRVLEGSLRARVYWPTRTAQPSAACLYFHGGGFVLGSLRSHDGFVRALASRTGFVFVAVDYRLAPEHKLPAAHDDALAAYRWVHAHAKELGIDPARIGLAGDSAGGNLVLATAISARDEGLPAPRALFPIYPAVDLTRSFPSHRELGHGYFLTKELLDWFLERFLQRPEQMRDPRVSPLFQTSLARLPPTHLVTAGFDPLRDEGEAMVTRLRESGVVVTHQGEDTLIHGFVSMAGAVPAAERAIARIADAMTARLA